MLTTGPGVKNHELFVIKIFLFFKYCSFTFFLMLVKIYRNLYTPGLF